MNYIIEKNQVKTLLDKISAGYEIFAPVLHNGLPVFEHITETDKVLSDVYTVNSPKGVVFPQTEVLLKFNLAKNKVDLKELEESNKKILIWGARACDAVAFEILDKLFNWANYKDEFYFNKRDKATIISFSCINPPDSCFCTSIEKGHPFSKQGSDLLLTEVQDGYYIQQITKKGEEFLNEIKSVLKPASADVEKEIEKLAKEAENKIKRKINTKEIKSKLDVSFESKYWDEASFPCVNCGACTYVCPTCYCFDIADNLAKTSGERVKTWDSCMFANFTKMGGGVNPRIDPKRRFRQRFNHKFKYFVENMGEPLCTGCGRCIKSCPVGIDIRKVLTEAQ